MHVLIVRKVQFISLYTNHIVASVAPEVLGEVYQIYFIVIQFFCRSGFKICFFLVAIRTRKTSSEKGGGAIARIPSSRATISELISPESFNSDFDELSPFTACPSGSKLPIKDSKRFAGLAAEDWALITCLVML